MLGLDGPDGESRFVALQTRRGTLVKGSIECKPGVK